MRIFWKETGIFTGAIILGIFVFLSWYKWTYSMDPVSTYEVNDPSLPEKVLIATQGSEYKNAVVDGIVAFLKPREVYIRVIDVAYLNEINTEEWNAIVVIHTWEMWKPPLVIDTFMNNAYDPKKIIVLTTSGDSDYKMEGVDAITSASNMEDVDSHIKKINDKLDQIIRKSLVL